ncbi:MAG: 3-hydroxyacyl-CoA dehydrogenase/enoyl-CoA hydratase family protein [Saprospiraceae bacterium]|nr:3-hydroxyacyl-CoA dehydrogenase/enoyl-CoA hydratase family protein [Saprospiraceae bacterium]
MNYRIQKVAVLGSGVMGSGIACHLANVGMEVLLLDIVPFDLDESEKMNPAARNRIVNDSLKRCIKSKPSPLYSASFANRISTGNFEDDFEKIKDADWIIEVVVERLDIKHQVFEKVEKYRKAGSLVTSNTSSIPIKMLAEGRSEEFCKHFCGTHFFNPPRYMPLLEVIPHSGSDQNVIDFFMDFGDVYLGKETVLCKDTPAFIANRIGVMSGTKMAQLTDKYEMRIEEVDAITGPLIARPKTATYRLQDLVGIDTSDKVSNFVMANVTNDKFFESMKEQPAPAYMKFLLDNKFLGNKTAKGFYEKTNEKDEKGKKIIKALNLKTLEYEKAIKPKLAAVAEAKGIELFDKRMNTLVDGTERENKFLKEYFAALFAYASNRVPEISDQYYAVDDAMRAGYMWSYGPFEYWDYLGIEKGIRIAEECGEVVADWVKDLVAKGITNFYRFENGQREYWNLDTASYQAVPGTESFIILDGLRDKTPIIKNSECTVHDIGDGVMCVEFTSKSNAIGEGIGKGIHEAVQKCEEEGWKGVVIGNNAKNFTVGANLMNVGMLAMQKQFDTLDKMVDEFQSLNMYLRTSKVPVVVATQGYVFGGGCEISMHCDAGIYAAESYIGLVEVGVGLLPGGGGTKEMALRASDAYFEGDVQIPTLINHFKPIATAQVATSAYEAFETDLLIKGKDVVCLKTPKNIATAKEKVLSLAEHYVPPAPRNDVEVLGRTGLSALYTAINEFRLGEYMSDYDVEVARKVAYVMCGGDLTGSQKVSEQYLLDIEREGFLSLLGNQKTLDRIQHILMYNRPLRN